MTHPFAEYRKLFPILDRSTQLSSCSQSALSVPVQQAIEEYMASWSTDGMDWGRWMEEVDGARAEFARLIGASPREVAILGCVSDAVSSVASCFALSSTKNTLICSDLDFPSIGHVLLAQQTRGAQVRFVPSSQQGTRTQDIEAAFDDSVSFACLSHVSYYNADRIDVAAATRAANQHDALLLIDAYQSAGALAIDVDAMGVDGLVAGAQKFLLGIPGIAFLYLRDSKAQQLATRNTGWFGQRNPFAFDIRTLDYADSAARFNTGTPPMICAYAARAGLKLLNEIGPRNIEAYLMYLSGVGRDEANRLGLGVAGSSDASRRGTSIAVQIKEAAKVEQEMRRNGYIVSARNDVVRVAPHFYNTEDEVVGALRALASLAL